MKAAFSKAIVDNFGRKVEVFIQRGDGDGNYWATTGKRNSDKGYTLFHNGSAVKQEYANGELISGQKVGTWVRVEEEGGDAPSIPPYAERQKAWVEGRDHIDVSGNLKVAVDSSYDPAPKREGWVPRFVSVNLDGWPSGHQKWVTYRRSVA
jgi:hypothetical protein